MKIATAPDFFDILKGKHLLLDASVFIDASIHETEFTELFNKLKANNITSFAPNPTSDGGEATTSTPPR